MQEASIGMGTTDEDERERLINRYARAEAEFEALGGYAVESQAAAIAASVGLPERVLAQPLGTLSGGQRRRVELARILFSGADVLLLDEPTNHLDADSIRWLRKFLSTYEGGFIVISHSTELLDETVNKVWHLDANRQEIDVYSMGWKAYLTAREADERRRRRERRNAEQQADALRHQAEKMRAKATKAKAAQSMLKRADKILASSDEVRRSDKVAALRFPEPKPCGRVPLMASGLSRSYGSLEVFTDVDLAIDKGSRVVILGLNGAGKTTLLRILAGVDDPGHRPRWSPATGRSSATTRRSTRPSTPQRPCWRPCARPGRTSTTRGSEPCWGRSSSRATRSASRRECCPAGRRRGWRWPAWSCPERTSCSSTSRRTTSTRRAGRRSSVRWRATRARSCSSRTTRAPSRPWLAGAGPHPAGRRRGPVE